MAEEEISTKEKIIQTTFSLLKDEVFNRLSLSRIAKEVGISKTAIYRHFESKDALDAAIRDRVFLIQRNLQSSWIKSIKKAGTRIVSAWLCAIFMKSLSI